VQDILVNLLIATAGLYIARATWRTWSPRATGCATGCGKCAAPAETNTRRVALPQV
jgi:hypothetical protein